MGEEWTQRNLKQQKSTYFFLLLFRLKLSAWQEKKLPREKSQRGSCVPKGRQKALLKTISSSASLLSPRHWYLQCSNIVCRFRAAAMWMLGFRRSSRLCYLTWMCKVMWGCSTCMAGVCWSPNTFIENWWLSEWQLSFWSKRSIWHLNICWMNY